MVGLVSLCIDNGGELSFTSLKTFSLLPLDAIVKVVCLGNDLVSYPFRAVFRQWSDRISKIASFTLEETVVTGGCVPALIQQGASSNYIKAQNRRGGSALVTTTRSEAICFPSIAGPR
jgi:hypothetical protein